MCFFGGEGDCIFWEGTFLVMDAFFETVNDICKFTLRVENVQSLEELKDVYEHFSLYFGNELAEMRKSQSGHGSLDDPSSQLSRPSKLKVSQKDFYTVCRQAGLLGMAEKFGLTPEQFGENMRDNYQRHETEQYPSEPDDVAQDYICQ